MVQLLKGRLTAKPPRKQICLNITNEDIITNTIENERGHVLEVHQREHTAGQMRMKKESIALGWKMRSLKPTILGEMRTISNDVECETQNPAHTQCEG